MVTRYPNYPIDGVQLLIDRRVTIINYYCPSLYIIIIYYQLTINYYPCHGYYQPLATMDHYYQVTIHYYPLLTIINRYQPLSTITNGY